jgi:hypothetical protein
MVAVIALIALTLFMWAVAVWATFEDEPDEPTRKEEEKPTDRLTETRRAA